MHVIEVIPLKKGVGVESLSYYSVVPYEPGSLVIIPLRSKEIQGVVVSCKPASAAKTALRTATFTLRKLPEQKERRALPKTLIKTAQATAEHVPAHIGSILFAMLPTEVRNGLRPYPQLPDHIPGTAVAPSVLTATTEDRYLAYRSYIREAFAHRGSVLFVVPTSTAVEEAKQLLASGIEKRVITFSSTHTTKKLAAAYEAFEDFSHSKLIIATPNFAFLCRHDITAIIIENSGSPYYVSRERPYLDARTTLKTFAKIAGCELLLGDNVPLTADEVLRREDLYVSYGEHPHRLQIPSNVIVAKHPVQPEQFSLLTKELADYINLTLSNRGRVFLFSSRRGLAPIVLCKDCGHIFRCQESGAPFSLLRVGSGEHERRWFYCATSGTRVPAADVCPNCGSWRLIEQGIGIQQVTDYIAEHFPKVPLFVMDHLTAGTHVKAKKICNEFYDIKKSILVGTSLALPYLKKPVECVGIISYEAMRSVPTWQADETVFQTLLTLRELTTKELIVQTRSEPDELLQLASRGLIDQFYDEEIAVRQSLGYPPFSTFILLTFTGTKAQTEQTEGLVGKVLASFEITFYNGPLSSEMKTIRFGLIRVPSSKFPDPKLVAILRGLPPYIKVEVNPAKII